MFCRKLCSSTTRSNSFYWKSSLTRFVTFAAIWVAVAPSVFGQSVKFDVPSIVPCTPVFDDRSFSSNHADQNQKSAALNATPVSSVRSKSNQTGAGRFAKNNLPNTRSKKSNSSQFSIHQTYKIPAFEIQHKRKLVSTKAGKIKSQLVFTFPVSVISSHKNSLDALYVELVPLSHTWRVQQITPESTISSDLIGPIAIERKADTKTGINASADGSYPALGNLNLNLQASDNSQTVQRQQLKPKALPIITSGTSDRGAGAFFRFRPAVDFLIEGNHLLAVVFEAPPGWRSDLVRVSCQAVYDGKVEKKNFLVTVFNQNDQEAEELAREFSAADRAIHKELFHRMQSKEKKSVFPNHFKNLLGRDQKPNWIEVEKFLLSGRSQISPKIRSSLPSGFRHKFERWVHAREKFLSLNHGSK